mmetsp:Transcript_16883/g.50426  ORF Transcript_16883/g.50426 Transcript_16883/m.50426 type:complete len:116 (-) Transcript_16883:24-371(-)
MPRRASRDSHQLSSCSILSKIGGDAANTYLVKTGLATATARALEKLRPGAVIVADPGRPEGRRRFLEELRGFGHDVAEADFSPVEVSAAALDSFSLGKRLPGATIGVFSRRDLFS